MKKVPFFIFFVLGIFCPGAWGQEFFVEAGIYDQEPGSVDIQLVAYNYSSQYETDLSCCYYFNIEELIQVGQSILDVRLDMLIDHSEIIAMRPCKVQGPFLLSVEEHIYYYRFSFEGMLWIGPVDMVFRLRAIPGPLGGLHWDSSNDYSFQDLVDYPTFNGYIPMYKGRNVDSGNPPEVEVYDFPGDANGDGKRNMTDALMITRHSVQLAAPGISLKSSDVTHNGVVDIIDALMVARFSIGLITEL